MGDLSQHFSRSEFECNCSNNCGYIGVDIEIIDILEKLRIKFKKPIRVHRGVSCPTYNKSLGSKRTSKHIRSIAVDFHVDDICHDIIYAYLEAIMPDWGGLGIYSWGIHLDIRSAMARWDTRK